MYVYIFICIHIYIYVYNSVNLSLPNTYVYIYIYILFKFIHLYYHINKVIENFTVLRKTLSRIGRTGRIVIVVTVFLLNWFVVRLVYNQEENLIYTYIYIYIKIYIYIRVSTELNF